MSSYIENSLIQDEKILHQAQISVWSLFPLIFSGGIVFPALGVFMGISLAPVLDIGLAVFLAPTFGVGVVLLLAAFTRYISTELAITNKRVIAKFGFISRSTVEINLPKIESIQVHQGIFGRIFDYGSLVISGAGSPKAPIPGIAQPLQFRKTFNQILENSPNKST
jgi:uncharacterized membrane protein YdbT with pleckstrin-like domain